jgi:hypothetical protein
MESARLPRWSGWAAVAAAMAVLLGCRNTPIGTSQYVEGPAPLRMPSPAADGCTYEDSLTGGEVFAMYCGACHNARSLAERPFSKYKNAAQHMRTRANLTGKEYAKLMAWLRQWHDVPPPHPPLEPSPKRLIFSQPISELREQPQSSPEVVPPGVPEKQQPARIHPWLP